MAVNMLISKTVNDLCAVMTKTEQHMTSSRGGYCVEKNLYIYGSQKQERTSYYMQDSPTQANF